MKLNITIPGKVIAVDEHTVTTTITVELQHSTGPVLAQSFIENEIIPITVLSKKNLNWEHPGK